MSKHTDPNDGIDRESNATQATNAAAGPSRRSVLKAAGVGTGALLLGTTPTNVAAQEATPRLEVDGNLIVTEDGDTVTLRGVNVVDPKRANAMAPARGRDASQHLDLITDEEAGWQPDVIRFPVQPVDIGEHPSGQGPEPPAFDQEQLDSYLENHLDPVIDQCAEAGVYAIVDFHRHRDVPWGDQEAGTINQELQDETISFWETVAPRYAEEDHVLYEVYNEPTEPGMWGEIGQDWVDDVWLLFLDFMQPIVDEVRSHADNVTLVGSPGWSQSPTGALVEPLEGENLAYTYHIYPGHEASQENDWEDSSINGQGVEAVYEDYPLFVTEFGWRNAGEDSSLDDLLSGTTTEFGEPFVEWLESHEAIHWTAWCADVWWEPAMFDPAFEESDQTVENVYEDEIPENCSDLPCEWNLLGADAGTEEDMGEFVRLSLESDGVPENYWEDESEDDGGSDGGSDDDGDSDGGSATDGNSTNDSDGGNESDDDGSPGFGVIAGGAGIAGGVGYALKRRLSDDSVAPDQNESRD